MGVSMKIKAGSIIKRVSGLLAIALSLTLLRGNRLGAIV